MKVAIVKYVAIALMLLARPAAPTRACSIVLVTEFPRPLVARNYDWHTGAGMLVVNKRQMAKRALAVLHPAQWTSKYGSVTFNQYGREFPCGGLNEKGLLVEVAWLDGTSYPRPDQRPGINALQWVQYQLDTSASIDDVLASDTLIRLQTMNGIYLHYFVAEKSGACATIEFLDGKMIVHRGEKLTPKVLTNSRYDESVQHFASLTDKFHAQPKCDGSSLGRFACAAARARHVAQRPTEDTVGEAFGILDQIAQGDFTKWQIVYDLRQARVSFKTHAVPAVRHFEMAQADFTSRTPVTAVDVNAELTGEVNSSMRPYTARDNQQLVRRAISETPVFKWLPKLLVDRLAEYPETCSIVLPEERIPLGDAEEPHDPVPAAVPPGPPAKAK